jgi:hypothetical protein
MHAGNLKKIVGKEERKGSKQDGGKIYACWKILYAEPEILRLDNFLLT